MLDICREAAELAGVSELLDLRLGDYSTPPVAEPVSLVLCPFRAYLHLHSEEQSGCEALRAAHDLLVPGGRLVFDVFTPSAEDIEETHGRWLEREPGIFERADWDTIAARADAVAARPGRRDDDGARLGLPGRVAGAAPRGRLHRRRVLRLVRPAAVGGRGGLDLDRHPSWRRLAP